MKTYLFGISTYAHKMVESGVLSEYSIEGLFDNAAAKWGTEAFGLKIERPYFNPEVEIIVAVKPSYYQEITLQLLDMGYRRYTVFIKKAEGVYEKKIYDYSSKDYQNDKENLVLLYLEHRSYSGIGALEYMCANKLVDTYSFRIQMFDGNENDPDYYYNLVTARYIITERLWNIQNIKARLIQLWHGFPLKAMGHMLTQYDEQKDGYQDEFWRSFDCILSYGLNYTTFMTACYGTLREQYRVTGMPRNDLLFLTDGKKNLAEKMPDSCGKRIVMYMPTFRAIMDDGITENGSDEGYLFFWKDFDFRKLEKFCENNNIFFVFKLHPSDVSKVREIAVQSRNIDILTDDMLGDKCMYEFLNAADVLVTDYSSVYFDYLLLDRPIVFTDSDVDSYAENRGLMLEPLDFWRPGPVVNRMDELLKTLKASLYGQDEYHLARERLMPFVHQYRDAGSTQRLFDLLLEMNENGTV